MRPVLEHQPLSDPVARQRRAPHAPTRLTRTMAIIESHAGAGDGAAELLRGAGHVVHTLPCTPTHVAELVDLEPELVVLYIAGTDMGMLHALRLARRLLPDTPLLVCGADHDAAARIVCFHAGADQYAPASVGSLELEERIFALLRRASPRPHAPRALALVRPA